MTKTTINDAFFWLGIDGDLEDVDEETFNQRQRDWEGDRPQDFEDETNPLNVQEGGSHYKDWVIQPIEYCMANNLDHCQSNVVKYVTRFRDKGGLDDLRKAKHYIDLLIHFEYGE